VFLSTCSGCWAGHVGVDQELVELVGFVAEVEAAVRDSGRQPHQVTQARGVCFDYPLLLAGAQGVDDE
jgi:hypothetical protein